MYIFDIYTLKGSSSSAMPPDPEEWEEKKPAQILIKSLLSLKSTNGINVIVLGGGHYTPRFTEAALTHEVCFGHMVANYGMPYLTEEMVNKAIDRSNAKGIYFLEIETDDGVLSKKLILQ